MASYVLFFDANMPTGPLLERLRCLNPHAILLFLNGRKYFRRRQRKFENCVQCFSPGKVKTREVEELFDGVREKDPRAMKDIELYTYISFLSRSVHQRKRCVIFTCDHRRGGFRASLFKEFCRPPFLDLWLPLIPIVQCEQDSARHDHLAHEIVQAFSRITGISVQWQWPGT